MTANSQLGVAEEVTFGTYVAPVTFNEFLSEGLEYEREWITSQGWRAGQRTYNANRRKQGRVTGGGPIAFELANKGMSKWLKHTFGAVAITTPGGGTLSRDHTFTLGDVDPLSLSVQVGKEDRSSTVRAFSYLGCKVASAGFHCAIGEFLTYTPELLIRDVTTAQTLGTATYPSAQELFTFVEGSLTIEGVATPVNEFDLTVDNMLNSEDFAFGSSLRRRGVAAAIRPITGSLNADFPDLVDFNLFKNGTVSTLVLLFQSPTIIEAALKYEVEFTVEVVFDGDTPKVEGPDEVRQPLRYTGVVPTAGGEAISVRLRTTDTTV
jgi:hypothetical protein